MLDITLRAWRKFLLLPVAQQTPAVMWALVQSQDLEDQRRTNIQQAQLEARVLYQLFERRN